MTGITTDNLDIGKQYRKPYDAKRIRQLRVVAKT